MNVLRPKAILLYVYGPWICYQNYGFLGLKRYGLWVMRGLWVFGSILLGTVPVPAQRYGLLRVMGYEGYGLGGVRLYMYLFLVILGL